MNSPEITQQDVDATRIGVEELVESLRVERRKQVSTAWKVICGLCTVIGALSGWLGSNYTYMSDVATQKVELKNLSVRVTENADLSSARFRELKEQADKHYEDNHILIQKIYDMHVK